MSITRVLMFTAMSVALASCSGGGGAQPAPTPMPEPFCIMPPVAVTFSLRSPADGSTGVSTSIALMDVAVQTLPQRGTDLPGASPGATLMAAQGANVTVGAFTLIAITPVSGGGVTGDFQAAVPALAAHTTYSVSLLTNAACPETIGSFTTL